MTTVIHCSVVGEGTGYGFSMKSAWTPEQKKALQNEVSNYLFWKQRQYQNTQTRLYAQYWLGYFRCYKDWIKLIHRDEITKTGKESLPC